MEKTMYAYQFNFCNREDPNNPLPPESQEIIAIASDLAEAVFKITGSCGSPKFKDCESVYRLSGLVVQ
jgi:hypothetical protein